MFLVALERLNLLFAAPVRREDVAEWANQEDEWTAGLNNTVEQPSWKHGYVIYLKMFYEIHSKWEQASEPEINAAVASTVEQVLDLS